MNRYLKKLTTLLLSIAILLTQLSALTVVSAQVDNFDGWEFDLHGCDASAILDDEYAYSGSHSMKVVNKTPSAPEVYVLGRYNVNVKAGKSYKVGAVVKSLRSSTVQFSINWERRYDLTPFGTTYGWTNYEFTWTAKETGTSEFLLIIDGRTEGLWLDDVKFVDKETGENLIKNPGFEGANKELDVNDTGASESVIELYERLSSSESFTAEEMEKVLGGFKYMPVYEQEGIVIDGKSDDWNVNAFGIPTLPTQYQVYMDDGKKKDATAVCMFAQDKENFYLVVEVTDDVFYYEPGGADFYWRGDSLQLAISGLDENYGVEIGLAHNPETGKGEVFANSLTPEQVETINLKTSANGNKIVYEAAIPWNVWFDSFPERIFFNVLANDNDGEGRRYCVELAPGISEGKTNVEFPMLEMLAEEKDWYAWTQGARKGFEDTEYAYDTFIINNGESKAFIITYPDGTAEKVEVPAKSGIRKSYKTSFEDKGVYNLLFKYAYGDMTAETNVGVKIEKTPASAAYHRAVIEKNKKNVEEIGKLLKKCEKNGISTDYEIINYKVMERFDTYLQQDLDRGMLDITYYTEEALDKLYNEAKENLNAYLNGEKEPQKVPRYITSDMRIDGDSVYAKTEMDGKVEERPVFFIGYGHFNEAANDMPLFNEIGMSTIQTEIGPTDVMLFSEFTGWEFNASNGPEYTTGITDEDVYEGDKSLKITYDSELKANQFISFSQYVPVEPGKTYNFKGYMKTKNTKNAWMSLNNWDDRIGIPVNSDWTEISASYTAPEGVTGTTVRINCDAYCDAWYIDALTFTEEGSDVNLLQNGGFEIINTKDYQLNANSGKLAELEKILQNAEKNNIAVSVLLSPHYFPTNIIEKYDIAHPGGAGEFIKYNIHADIAKEIIEEYLRFIVPKIKDYKSLNNICISNEPLFKPERCGDFYLDDWHNFLKEIYGNDIGMLNRAYGATYGSFEEIPLSYANDVMEYDYKMFNDKVFSEWHRWMAGIVHELAPDVPLHSKLMNYLDDDDIADRMKRGVGYEKYYDFLELNGCDAHDYINDGSRLYQVSDGYHVEKMWYDYMRSIKDAPVINSEDHIIPDRSENYSDEVADYVAQNMWQGAIHGRANSTIWAWQRANAKTEDFYGLVLYRPDVVAAISKEALNLNRNAYEVTALQNDDKEVGILYSDSSIIQDMSTSYAIYQAYSACLYSGKAVQFVTPSQLHKMNYCKVLIVPQSTHVTAETLDYIKQFIENGGKVMIIGQKSLKKNEKGFDNDADKLNYIFANSYVINYDGAKGTTGSITETELHDEIRKVLSQAGVYNVFVKDSVSGEATDYVEYNIGVYNGDIILNMVSYEEDKKVKIFLGDKVVTSSYDINNNVEFGEEISLKRYDPVTVRIDVENCFIDTFGHWAENDIVEMAKKGIVKGVSESRFAPNKTLTRAEFLSLLMRGIDVQGGNTLPSDADASSWYAKDVSKAVEAGVIGTDAFRPSDYITREEMCQMLVKGYEYAKGTIEAGEEASFTDRSVIGDFEAVSKAYSLGLMLGRDDGSFGPLANATRAEAAAVIARFNTLK